MEILPISPRLVKYLKSRGLSLKFEKQSKFLQQNFKHPGLNVELLEPREKGIYGFRIEKKYRALFFFRDDLIAIQILAITSHYQ